MLAKATPQRQQIRPVLSMARKQLEASKRAQSVMPSLATTMGDRQQSFGILQEEQDEKRKME